MSAELAPPAETPAGTIRCPRCGAGVARDQDWCLRCGYAARTTLARTPRWRILLIVAAMVAAVALGALAVAFVDLTNDPAPATTATGPAPAAAPTAPPAPAPPATPTATVPPAAAPEATGTSTATVPTPGAEAP